MPQIFGPDNSYDEMFNTDPGLPIVGYDPSNDITVTGPSFDNTGDISQYFSGPGGVFDDRNPGGPTDPNGLGAQINLGLQNYDAQTPTMQKIVDKFNNLYLKLTDKRTYDPKNLLKEAIKAVTGYDPDTGKWDPLTALGTGVKLTGVGGVASLISDIYGAFKFFGIDAPEIDVGKAIESNPHIKDGEFIPNNPYTTAPDGKTQIPDTRNYNVIPQIGADGKVNGIVVGSQDGSDYYILDPKDMETYGITPENMTTFDYSSLTQHPNHGTDPLDGTPGGIPGGITTTDNGPGPGQTNNPGPNTGTGGPIDEIVVNGTRPGNDNIGGIIGGGDTTPGGQMQDGSGGTQIIGTTPDGIPIIQQETPPNITVTAKNPEGGNDIKKPPIPSGPVGLEPDPNGGAPIVTGGPVDTITVTGQKPFIPVELPPIVTVDPGPHVDDGTNPGNDTKKPEPKPIPSPTPGPLPGQPIPIGDPPPNDGNPGSPGPSPSPSPSPSGPTIPDFHFFAMPNFQILPNDFGHAMIRLTPSTETHKKPDSEETFKPQDHT